MFGRLTLEAFKHDWIEYLAGVSMILGAIFLIALLTYYQDAGNGFGQNGSLLSIIKKLGSCTSSVSFIMLSKGLIDAVMMRAQQAFAVGDSMGYLTASHFQQIFTAHGVTMIFFVGMGVDVRDHQFSACPCKLARAMSPFLF